LVVGRYWLDLGVKTAKELEITSNNYKNNSL